MTNPDDAELKPCWSCGGQAKILGGPLSQEMEEIWCENIRCLAHAAPHIWNTRTPSPLLAPIKAFLTSVEQAYVNIDGVSKVAWDELQRVLKEVENG